jgi:hypothetical protein
MSRCTRVLREDDLSRAPPGTPVNVAPYRAIVDEVALGGVDGELEPDEDENRPATCTMRVDGGLGIVTGPAPPGSGPRLARRGQTLHQLDQQRGRGSQSCAELAAVPAAGELKA